VAAEWGLGDEIVLIGAGERIPIPGRGDRSYPFRAHSEYLYLTDRERPGGVLAFDPQEGWVDFVVPVTREEMLWEGGVAEQDGVPVSELEGWMARRAGSPVERLGAQAGSEGELRAALGRVRRRKDEVELERMRAAERRRARASRRWPRCSSPGCTSCRPCSAIQRCGRGIGMRSTGGGSTGCWGSAGSGSSRTYW